MQAITPFLWFDNQAEEAANFYTGIFRNSSICHVARNTADTPGAEGSALVVKFTLNGQGFTALNGGPQFRFNEAVSFVVNCENQDEIDYFWERLSAHGGQPGRCGWLKDQYGLSWQVVPARLGQLLGECEPAQAAAVMRALMQMDKLDIATLEQARAEG